MRTQQTIPSALALRGLSRPHHSASSSTSQDTHKRPNTALPPIPPPPVGSVQSLESQYNRAADGMETLKPSLRNEQLRAEPPRFRSYKGYQKSSVQADRKSQRQTAQQAIRAEGTQQLGPSRARQAERHFQQLMRFLDRS